MAFVDFVDQMDAPSFSALTSFPSTDFSAAATAGALKWTDLEQNVLYQIVSTRTVNIQHGQSIILSLQKADGSSLSVWACGILSTELFQNPNDNGKLAVVCTGNWKENEQKWSSLQFVSAAAVVNLIM